jgi:hypothetical protein
MDIKIYDSHNHDYENDSLLHFYTLKMEAVHPFNK